MDDLVGMTCVACRRGAPTLTNVEIVALHPQVPEWRVIDRSGVKQLERVFSFKDFVQALAFTVLVGQAAEAQGHHPVITTEWGKATVTWWTHKIGGLHQNDFIMAAKTDETYASQ